MGAICSAFQKDKLSPKCKKPESDESKTPSSSAVQKQEAETPSQATVTSQSKAEAPSSVCQIKVEVIPETPDKTSPPEITSDPLAPEMPPVKRLSTSQPYHKIRRLSYDPRLMDELPDLRYCSDDVRSLLLGRVRKPDIKSNAKEISIYVCTSSFETESEFDLMYAAIFPTLRHRVAEMGYELNVVNLHCGMYADCIDDHTFREICIETLENLKKRGKLIILVLYKGKIYEPCLPRVIEETDFDNFIRKVESDKDRDYLRKWYRLDENNIPPRYVLQSIRYNIPNIISKNISERKEAIEMWRKESATMINILSKILPDRKKANYLSLVLEEEINRTVIENKGFANKCLLVNYSTLMNGDSGSDSAQVGSSVISQLEEILPKNRIISLETKDEESQEKFSAVQDEIKKIVENIVEADSVEEETKTYKGMEEPLHHELLLQWWTSKIHSAKFIGRQDVLMAIRQYLEGQSSSPLIVYGPAGCGKTGLMAAVSNLCSSWMPNTAIILRHIGISSESATLERILRSISEHCCSLIGEHVSLAFKNMQEHNASFEILIRRTSQKYPMNILIDGLDQVANYSSRDLSWIPTKLPRQTKFILTLRDNSPELKQLRDIFPESSFLSIPSLTSIEAMSIIDEILINNKRVLTNSQKTLIRNCLSNCPNPRYARILGYSAIKWQSSKNVDNENIPNNIEDLVESKLSLLGDYVGEEVMNYVIGLLGAAKHGLTDEEMLDLLSCEDAALECVYHDNVSTFIRFPRLIWHLIKRYLYAFLDVRTECRRNVTTWKNQFYKYRCWEHIKEQKVDKYKMSLVDYFSGKWAGDKYKLYKNKFINRLVLDQPVVFGSVPNCRKLSELPMNCLDQGCPIAKASYLFSPEWIVAKCGSSDPYEFLEDIDFYIYHNSDNADNEVYVLRDVMHLSSYALRYDSTQFYSQFYNRLKSFMSEEENAEKYPLLQSIYERTVKPPIPSLLSAMPCLLKPVGSIQEEQKTDSSLTFNSIFTIKDDPYHAVTLSEERKEIIVWDIHKSIPVRTLRISQSPRDIKILNGNRALVLCNRELVLYDLNRGKFVLRLKGIMNQKMPYYGIQDNKYVIALSRNRMYVNVMSLETGDMETTFKVGEDRFLNSLLVSADGRICVCGDETQKPFPLLVWDLTERKLIYDLRIPQHEFLTNMTAISDDSRYLVSICKELPLDDPSPNFIVVYELESGTLFKKWKPDSNTWGIAISHFGNIVVNGLENGSVLVWDLITGGKK
ncbi:NACHT domain- and WD repeat-containing protein 1-like [Centruroides sculpturatus]|uniref:NACHT domain- and WD repeat-containing protein 1-like n=1 Tax=Centruroides sculpturatus TaxID=218467 RepID=UPI000C6EEFEF|nr:NACHT domain- and WD repeat-containing protein 1-like [Centruroides sculpturatus]